MDYEFLVDDRVEDGRSIITGLVNDGFNVTVALWVKTTDEGLWFFYVGSTSLRTMSLADAYRLVYGVLRTMPHTRIALSEIKLVDVHDPLARRAIEMRDRFPARLPTRYDCKGSVFGNLALDELYIYPSSGTMSREEVLLTVTGLMQRTGARGPSLVTLRDGTRLHAVAVGLHANAPGAIQVVFHDLNQSMDRAIPIDDVVGIL